MDAPTTSPSSAADAALGPAARMIDVSPKPATARAATASGRLLMSAATFAKLVSGALTKGNPLPHAELAALLGAKKTAELIPLCHPLPLDQVISRCELEPERAAIKLSVTARAHAKTGVEMEALTGVMNGLLALYDVIKADDPALSITDVALDEKMGGKSGHYLRDGASAQAAPMPAATPAALAGVAAAVITVSDRVSAGQARDTSGPLIAAWLREQGAEPAAHTVADDRPAIGQCIRDAARAARLVVLTGGTGLSPRDVTPEALADVCDRAIPGFGEAFRAKTAHATDKAYLSRASAGLCDGTLVLALPGSERAVREGLTALAGLIPHALHIAAGGAHGS